MLTIRANEGFNLMSLFFPVAQVSWLFPGKHGYFPVLGKNTISTHPVHPGTGVAGVVTSGTLVPVTPPITPAAVSSP